jgi:hypothetical protein
MITYKHNDGSFIASELFSDRLFDETSIVQGGGSVLSKFTISELVSDIAACLKKVLIDLREVSIINILVKFYSILLYKSHIL